MRLWFLLILMMKIGNFIWGTVLLVSISQSFPCLFFTSRHPAASLAATSANLFPSIFLWVGTQWSSGLISFLPSMLIEPMINRNIFCPDWLSGFSVQRMAPWSSVKIVAWLTCESVWDRIILKALAIPCKHWLRLRNSLHMIPYEETTTAAPILSLIPLPSVLWRKKG